MIYFINFPKGFPLVFPKHKYFIRFVDRENFIK